jgi:Histidine kinase-, DNA gyrase B-, and HSP90-like ATPase
MNILGYDFSCAEETKNPLLPHKSLAQLLGHPNIELTQLIANLTPLAPESIKSLDDLADKIRASPSCSDEERQNIRHLVNNLIFKQFPHPAVDAVRELVSNSLDAQVRAKRESSPLSISLQKDRLVIHDRGDGMGWGTLVNYFVPGRSSNPQAIFSLEEGIPKVTGRFGQGAMSMFYFLLYHTLSASNQIPSFIENQGQMTLKVEFFLYGQLYEGLFSHRKGEERAKITCHEIQASGPKKIKIHTCYGREALKLKFFEERGQIKLDICQDDNFLYREGSRFKIVSPLIETSAIPIMNSIRKVFGFVSSTPILINEEPVNTCQALKKLELEKGSLWFSALSSPNLRCGSVSICEEGKLILELPLKGSYIPEKMVLNFNHLTLTQDRASIDFKDPKSQAFILDGIQAIWSSSQLTVREKSALFNAFYPLLKPERFNLIPFILKYTSDLENVFPDLTEFETLNPEKTFLLNPSYLQAIQQPAFYKSGSSNFYLIDGAFSTPVLYSHFGGKKHFFLESRLFHPKLSKYSFFNLMLLNQWFEQKGYTVQIDPETVFDRRIPKKTETKPQLNVKNSACDDWKKYEKQLDADELLDECRLFLHQEVAVDSSVYPREVQEEVIEYLSSRFSRPSKKIVRYLYHYLCQDKDARELYIKNKFYNLYEKELPLETLASIIFHTVAYLKTHPDEIEYYETFWLHSVSCSKDLRKKLSAQPFSYEFFQEIYYKWKLFIKASGCLDDKLIESSLRCCELTASKLDYQRLLMKKAANKKQLFDFILILDDIPYLLTLPSFKLNPLFDALSRFVSLTDKIFGYEPFNQTHYQAVFTLLDRLPDPLEIKIEWIALYLMFLEHTESVPIKLSFESFQNLLVSSATESKKAAEIQKIFNDLDSSIRKLQKFSYRQEALIFEITNLIRDKPDEYSLKKEFAPRIIQELSQNPFLCGTLKRPLEGAIEDALEWLETLNYYRNDPSAENHVALCEKYIQLLERTDCLLPRGRPFIYAALIGGEGGFLSQNYLFPEPFAEALFLYCDPDVLANIKDEKLAAARIQNAMNQTIQENAWIGEVVKNSLEAGATKIDFEVHLDPQAHLIVVLTDNGQGMGEKELRALKTPGCTSKKKETKDPNFGWGFFTLFREFDAVYVSTSPDGRQRSNLLFEKDQQTLMLQTEVKKETGAQGTTLILKKRIKNTLEGLIKIKAQITATCRYLKNTTVSFQHQPIATPRQQIADVNHNEPIIVHDSIGVQISNSNEGVYCKDLRIGDCPEEYLALLPQELKEMLTTNGMRFTIFLSHVQQNMNRNHFINHSSLSSTIQRGVLAASIKYCLRKCLKDGELKVLSNDYWVDFRQEIKKQPPFLKRLARALKHQDWNRLVKQKDQTSSQLILKELRTFFTPLEKHSLSFSCYQNAPNLTQLLQAIEHVVQKKNRPSVNKKVKQFLNEPRSLAQVLLHLPLLDKGQSLLNIRSYLKMILGQNSILTSQGTYCKKLTDFDPTFCKQQVAKCIQRVRNDLGLDSSYDVVMAHFFSSILKHISGMRAQHSSPPIKTEQSEQSSLRLVKFLKHVAKELLNRDIEVTFYSSSDNANAHTYSGSNMIYINQRSHRFKSFSLLLQSYEQAMPHSAELDDKLVQSLAQWLQILCHELTHQEEKSDCSSTHDETFRDRLCQFLQDLFIRETTQKNWLQIFQE